MSTANITALWLALLLVAYPNIIAFAVARNSWDQWHAFTIGNTVLASLLFAYAVLSGILTRVWGHSTPAGVLFGFVAGLVPLIIIVLVIFLPGQLGRDVVAAGIGDISLRRFIYRLSVQVALTTVVCEEFAFRGVLYVALTAGLGVAWAIGSGAVLFGVWHVVLQYNGFTVQSRPVRWLAATGGAAVYAGLGLMLLLVRQSTGSLLAAIVAHGILDVGMFAAMFIRRRQFAGLGLTGHIKVVR